MQVMRKRNKQLTKYAVFLEWGYAAETDKPYSRCIIGHATIADERQDGFNFVGRGGNEGMQFDIYNSLEAAILKANFNPRAITFDRLSKKELRLKNKILAKYEWTAEGLKLKMGKA